MGSRLGAAAETQRGADVVAAIEAAGAGAAGDSDLEGDAVAGGPALLCGDFSDGYDLSRGLVAESERGGDDDVAVAVVVVVVEVGTAEGSGTDCDLQLGWCRRREGLGFLEPMLARGAERGDSGTRNAEVLDAVEDGGENMFFGHDNDEWIWL